MSDHNGNGKMSGGQIMPIDGNTPAWITTMRDAARKVLKAEDVEQIVRNQVEAAKKGNKDAIKFVFEQVLGGQQVKAQTFVQNNYHDGVTPDVPTNAVPGTKDKLKLIERRIAAGRGGFDARDREDVDLT